MRNISFMITPNQILAETKTVTRRMGWRNLKPGVLLQGVRKSQGLRKGEKIERLKVIRVESVRIEPLSYITHDELILEGFPDMTVSEFINMFCNSHKGATIDSEVTRIEFSYANDTDRLF